MGTSTGQSTRWRWRLLITAMAGAVCLSAQAPAEGPLTAAERDLAQGISQLRAAQGLPAIPVTQSLAKVARLHVQDLNQFHPNAGTDSRGLPCNLHSWSANGSWTPVCYTDDHNYKLLMWSKPREITTVYTTDGFEIAHTNGAGATSAGAIAGWTASSGHLDVILQRGSWSTCTWKAMGVAIGGTFAVVWLGASADSAGPVPEPAGAATSTLVGSPAQPPKKATDRPDPVGPAGGLSLKVTNPAATGDDPVTFVVTKLTPGSADLGDAHYAIEIWTDATWVTYFRSGRMVFGQGPMLESGKGKSWSWDRSHDDRQHKASPGRKYRIRFFAPKVTAEVLTAEFELKAR